MSSVKRKRDMHKASKQQKQEKQNTDPIWSIEKYNHQQHSQQLQSEAEANSRLRQQINKQSYADSAVQIKIKDNINQLKNKAVLIAQNLQCEKRKNVQLQAIIRHIVQIRAQEKNLEATFRDDINFQSADNLLKKIKKSQYDLQQILAKFNDIVSKNKEKKGQIDTYRTQRVIDSGIFLKIQKQIVDTQNQYKKLLIQKTRFQQQYNNSLQNYKKIRADIQKQQYISLSKRQSNEKNVVKDPQYLENEQFFLNVPQIQHAAKFTDITSNEPKRKSFIGSRKTLNSFQIKKQQHYQEIQLTIKKLFIQTGLNSVQSLINQLINIEKENNELYQIVNKDTDKICSLTQKIEQLNKKNSKKSIKYYQKQPEPTKNEIRAKQCQVIHQQLNKMETSCQKQLTQLNTFLKNSEIRQICKVYNVAFSNDMTVNELQDLFGMLELKINPVINHYYQFKQEIDHGESLNNRQSQERQTVQQLINKIKRIEQSEKIMIKQDFKKQYEKLLKTQNLNKTRNAKKKTTFVKKH